MRHLHECFGRLHIVRRLRGTDLPNVFEPVAGEGQFLPPLQKGVPRDEGLPPHSQPDQHVRVWLSLRLRGNLLLRKSKAPLQPVHWVLRAAKVPFLPSQYQSAPKWSHLACPKWLWGQLTPVHWLQPERILDVLRLGIAAAEWGPRVQQRHGATRWPLQTPASAREILVPFRARQIGPESDWNAWVHRGRDQYVQRQSSAVLPHRARPVLVCKYDHEVL